MDETIIAGTELKLTARIEEDGVISVQWDRLATRFLFHEGYAAVLRRGSGDTEGMIELTRMRVEVDQESIGHVEPLLSAPAA